jgi:predicted PurR-regulated permease PerM
MARRDLPSLWPQSVGPAPPASGTGLLLLLVVVVAALYFGQDILIPLALAILLSFALAPVATHLRRWGLGRVPSVIAVVLLVVMALIGAGSIVANQVVSLAGNLSLYEWNLRTKIRSFSEAIPSGGVVERTTDMLRDLRKELEEAAKNAEQGGAAQTTAPGPADPAKPLPVEVHQPDAPPVEALQEFAGPLVEPVATAGLVLVFVVFMLLQREDLRDRVIRLVGSSDVRRTTEAMNDAAKRISRYLLMQLIINVLYGVPVGIGLYFIGVPSPILWGLLATVLRFVPYVGPVIAASFPIALSFAADPGWTMPLLTVALFLILELFSNNVLEPWLYGSSTGLSPVAVLVAAVFWTTLWGPAGLLLSTPLTVCLVVLGRHVPQLGFFDIMLGDEPALASELKFYQRLLSRDPDEATEMAEEYLEDEPLESLYDAVILPALALADEDRLSGSLDRDKVKEIAEDTIGVVEYLADEEERIADQAEADARSAPPSAASGGVLCIGPRNGLDEAAAALLAHLLARNGLGCKTLPHDAVSIRNLSGLERDGTALICLSYVNPAATRHAQRLVRRLRQHFGPDVRIMVGLWTAEAAPGEPEEAIEVTGADLVATSLRQAVRQVQETFRPEEAATATSAA